ncbi:MAG: hypothetical protein IKO35_02920 [Elusimicrobiaceae bacterium]|nr:hypothetical protein [Elusimicrobiaceae bacterium]
MKSTNQTIQIPGAPLPADFMQTLPGFFSSGGTIIHNARNQIRVFDVNGRKINIKKFCIPPIVNRILYSLGWRTPKAVATYRNAQEILKRGFHTPAPYGYRIERKGGLINFSYFISEQIENMRPIREGGSDPALIQALAQYTAALHAHGLFHRDFTPGNILYRVENGEYQFSLVDINRFRFFDGPAPRRFVLRNLMQPFHDDNLLKCFVQAYQKHVPGLGDMEQAVLRRRHWRNFYDNTKRQLKKIPGVSLFLGKNLKK